MIDFSPLWLIVPAFAKDVSAVSGFLKNHKWFLQNAGHILIKMSATQDSTKNEKEVPLGTTFIWQSDTSVYDAWNQGIEYLEGIAFGDDRYVAFMGIDDCLSMEFISQASSLINREPRLDIIYGDTIHRYRGMTFRRTAPKVSRLFNADSYTFDIGHPGVLNRWELVKGRRFDCSLKLAADLDFYIGISQAQTVQAKKVDSIQAVVGSEGISNTPSAKLIYECEWNAIEQKRGVSIDRHRSWAFIAGLIARSPRLFEVIRVIVWKFRQMLQRSRNHGS